MRMYDEFDNWTDRKKEKKKEKLSAASLKKTSV